MPITLFVVYRRGSGRSSPNKQRSASEARRAARLDTLHEARHLYLGKLVRYRWLRLALSKAIMTSLGEHETSGRREANASIARISPAIPVRPAAGDAEAIKRFPTGYPHIVALTDEDGTNAYAVRLRTIGGRLDLIGETTLDLSDSRESLRNLHGDLLDAMRYNTNEDLEDAVEAAFLKNWWPGGREADTIVDAEEDPSGWPRVHYPDLDDDFLKDIPNYFPIILSMNRNGQRYYTHAFKDTTGYLCWPDPWSKEPRNCLHSIEHAAMLRVAQWEEINSIPAPGRRFFR